MHDKARSQGREHKTEGGQGPNKAHITVGHEVKQTPEERRLKPHSNQQRDIGETGADESQDLRHTHAVHLADLFQASAQEHDPNGLHAETH